MNCPHCREAYEEKPEVLREIGIDPAIIKREPLVRGKGCAECRGLGYRGRSGILRVYHDRRGHPAHDNRAPVRGHNQVLRPKDTGNDQHARRRTGEGPSGPHDNLRSAARLPAGRFRCLSLPTKHWISPGPPARARSPRAIARTPRSASARSASFRRRSRTVKTSAAAKETAAAAGEAKVATTGKKVGRLEILLFTRKMADLLDAGLPMDRAFSVLIDQTDNLPLKALLSAMQGDIRAGQPLSDALQKFPREFPKLYANMVRAGEVSGQLAPVMTRLAEFMEKEQVRREPDRRGAHLSLRADRYRDLRRDVPADVRHPEAVRHLQGPRLGPADHDTNSAWAFRTSFLTGGGWCCS